MKITKNEKLIRYIESLIDTNYLNMSLSDMLSEVIGNRNITDKNEIDALKNKFKENDLSLLMNKCLEYWEIDTDSEEDMEIFKTRIIPSFKEIDINKYLNNPYYKNIKIRNIVDGEYSLVNDHYVPYEIFAYQDMEVNPNFEEINSLSFFKSDFFFPAINYRNTTWMSITPNEIETMQKAVNEAYGVVTVYGLGLGYFPYMISLKESVKEIIIIEKDKKIVTLFKKYLLPQFQNKEKITIIENDAFNYMQESHYFDYSFIDLWHNPLDGIELFLRCKKLEKENKRYFYWLESSFYILLRRCFISFLEEQLAGAKEENYQKSKNITDTIINTYFKKTKNLVLSDIFQIQDLLSDKSLLDLLK